MRRLFRSTWAKLAAGVVFLGLVGWAASRMLAGSSGSTSKKTAEPSGSGVDLAGYAKSAGDAAGSLWAQAVQAVQSWGDGAASDEANKNAGGN